jgi:hypothetical protein
MSTEQFTNTAASTLAAALLTGQTSLQIPTSDASKFPSVPQFRLRIVSEILLVTGITPGMTNTTFTVKRAQEGTQDPGTTYAAGTTVTEVLTAAALAQFQQDTVARAWNYLFNGGFDFAQRQAPGTLTAYANGAYGPDRWYLLGDSGATDIQYSRVDETANALNSRYSGQVENNNGAAKHTGIAQIIEAVNSVPLRGRTVRFQVRVKTSTASRNMRCAILEWTGTADAVAFGGSVGRDPVNNWASTNYTAGNFFNNTNLVVVGVSASTTPGTSYTDLFVTGTVDTACNNLVCMVWEESATPAAGSWNLMQAGLFDGINALAWLPRPIQHELALCQRYYEKSVSVDVAPTSGGLSDGFLYLAWNSATSIKALPIRFVVPKRTASPTVTIYDAAGNAGKVYANGNNVAGTAAYIGMNGFDCQSNGSVNSPDFACHFTAEAEL